MQTYLSLAYDHETPLPDGVDELRTPDALVERYLEGVERAFRRVDSTLAEDARIVVDVANMRYEGEVTTLAWDLCDVLRGVFDFEGEVVVTWTGDGPEGQDGTFGHGYDHSYCLQFSTDSTA